MLFFPINLSLKINNAMLKMLAHLFVKTELSDGNEKNVCKGYSGSLKSIETQNNIHYLVDKRTLT